MSFHGEQFGKKLLSLGDDAFNILSEAHFEEIKEMSKTSQLQCKGHYDTVLQNRGTDDGPRAVYAYFKYLAAHHQLSLLARLLERFPDEKWLVAIYDGLTSGGPATNGLESLNGIQELVTDSEKSSILEWNVRQSEKTEIYAEGSMKSMLEKISQASSATTLYCRGVAPEDLEQEFGFSAIFFSNGGEVERAILVDERAQNWTCVGKKDIALALRRAFCDKVEELNKIEKTDATCPRWFLEKSALFRTDLVSWWSELIEKKEYPVFEEQVASELTAAASWPHNNVIVGMDSTPWADWKTDHRLDAYREAQKDKDKVRRLFVVEREADLHPSKKNSKAQKKLEDLKDVLRVHQKDNHEVGVLIKDRVPDNQKAALSLDYALFLNDVDVKNESTFINGLLYDEQIDTNRVKKRTFSLSRSSLEKRLNEFNTYWNGQFQYNGSKLNPQQIAEEILKEPTTET